MKGKTLIFTVNKVQRQLYELLVQKGADCVSAESIDKSKAKEFLKEFDNIVLPFPSSEESISKVIGGKVLSDVLSENQVVIGGLIYDDLRSEIIKANAKQLDYFENEAYVLKNAFITSQGALKVLLDTTDDFVVGKKVLVTGFGKIGKSISVILKNLGMKVFVAVRSDKARVEALSMGFDVLSFNQLSGAIFYFDFIFNTVPERVFENRDIKHMRDDAFYFELASKPFGADKTYFDEYDKNYISANGLPGKYYPAAVAENIYNFICSFGGE